MPVQFADREGALAAARKEVPFSLTKPHESLIILMDPARPLEWVSRNGIDQKKDVKNENHQNAVLLYTRGVEPDEPCKSCANGAGTFRRCIAAPDFLINEERRSLFVGACANCVWNSKGSQCSFYLGKGHGWDTKHDSMFLQRGGLLATMNGNPVRQISFTTNPNRTCMCPIALILIMALRFGQIETDITTCLYTAQTRPSEIILREN
ncbi:DUF3716 domain-containing protein [Aspergillus fischeri NRRL 181]|uniref:Uncharacterized protein n=1 Tax=Neosartorya fischeri (strain ATCC 1020 / DSM 3700 / CBS 544.65 / FGSC A1164 / JCM 1740 / NRRL 181 / WB 181) TaxID=331117 RepID=A1DLI9_NEOFI|nr:uncharacterized protein NFIA_050020 [Aspergillus fischeri NRRL 181]EAW15660.1 hypothetical protein NFIA_050020 [Aspergillus fischeri NRRL 181]KAG2026092.1 hypothetical protein GB937_002238 [Aspergillus fischeri]